MTNKPIFKAISTVIFTGLFGYLMYMLIDSVKTGLFFTEATGQDVIILGTAMMIGPIVLSIICSIIYKRYIWLLSIPNLFLWIIIGAAMGEETTSSHAIVYGAAILVPYILCLVMILGKKNEGKTDSYPVSSSSSYSGYTHSSNYGSSGRSLGFEEKDAYIRNNCLGALTSDGMKTIDNDPNLSPSQKQELKDHLRYYGD